MTYLAINIIILIILTAIGRVLLLKIEGQERWSGAEPLVGYSFAIICFSFYFVIDIEMVYLAILFSPVVAYAIGFSCKNYINKINKKYIIIVVAAALLPSLIFSYLFYLYGGNFIVFRGNIWDAFNYNTMAVAYSKYKYTEFDQLISNGSAVGYIAKQNLVQRPSVVLIPAIVLSFLHLDNFSLIYFYKAFLLSLYTCSMLYLCRNLRISLYSSIFLSISFTFSSWIFYIVEIDALSNLAFLPFMPIFAAYLYESKRLELSERPVFFILATASFIIYPEFGSILLLSLLISIAMSMRGSERINIRRMAICLAFAVTLIFVLRAQTIYFLIRQISGAATTTADWWGYFGAYVLGPHSPVTDPEFVLKLKAIIASGEGLSGELKKLFFTYGFNLLPSVFGFFHLLSIDLLVIPANLMAGAIIIIGFKWLLRKNKNDEWIRFAVFILILIIIIFSLRGSFWSAIKGLSWILTMLPIILILSFADLRSRGAKFISIFCFAVIPMFVPYKYQVYNYGIGVHDGFPSILNKATKIDNDWYFDRSKISSCENIKVETSDSFKRHFYFLQLENMNMSYSSSYPILESYGVGKIVSQLKNTSDVDCELL
jgi:hypothetical protein